MINARCSRRWGRTASLINMARGSVVDEPALIKALQDKTIMSAGLDVFAEEPKVPAELIAMDHVVLLPHVGSASRAYAARDGPARGRQSARLGRRQAAADARCRNALSAKEEIDALSPARDRLPACRSRRLQAHAQAPSEQVKAVAGAYAVVEHRARQGLHRHAEGRSRRAAATSSNSRSPARSHPADEGCRGLDVGERRRALHRCARTRAVRFHRGRSRHVRGRAARARGSISCRTPRRRSSPSRASSR